MSQPLTEPVAPRPFAVRVAALPLWLAAAALLGAAYLVSAWVSAGVTGFPLDDAWIHQTYARNLGLHGEWAFVPGQMSAGSTAPLWSLLLALGYWLRLPPLEWTYGLGITALGATAWLAAGLTHDLLPKQRWAAWLGGLACLAEWHLVWAAVSGMETVLYVSLALAVVRMTGAKHQIASARSDGPKGPTATAVIHLPFAVLGFTGGLLVLTRPEGLVLVGLSAGAIGWTLRHARWHLAAAWIVMGLGLALPLLPYLTFHYQVTGQPFPNTFYAKQQEYRALLELLPVWQRWLSVAGATLVGGQVLLVPGLVWAAYRAVGSPRSLAGVGAESSRLTSPPNLVSPQAERRMGGEVLPLPPAPTSPPAPPSTPWQAGEVSSTIPLLASWWLAHLTLYALRLPVTYQHGRYEMPVIPALVIVGLVGTVQLLECTRHPRARRVVSRSAPAAAMLLWVAFLIVGGRAYATDVGFVEGEMVTTARWLAENTSADSLIAAHDIGAVGYFAQRRLLDLAGLITPEVVPFITEHGALMAWMLSQQVDYVVLFPDWSAAYRRLADDPRLQPVYVTGFAWTRQAGHQNMTVYRLRPSPHTE